MNLKADAVQYALSDSFDFRCACGYESRKAHPAIVGSPCPTCKQYWHRRFLGRIDGKATWSQTDWIKGHLSPVPWEAGMEEML